MEPEFHQFEVGEHQVLELVGGVIATERDVTDVVGNASFGGAAVVFIDSGHLASEFSDLSSGLAGVVLQKFSNYRLPLIVFGLDQASVSESMRALILECNRGGPIRFAASREDALALLPGLI